MTQLDIDTHIDESDLPEHRLWQAVWQRALIDAVRLDIPTIRWLLGDSNHLAIVAELAGVDLAYYRPRLQAVLVLLARVVASNQYPTIGIHSVKWRRSTKRERERAEWLLASQFGDLQSQDLPWSDLRWLLSEVYQTGEAA